MISNKKGISSINKKIKITNFNTKPKKQSFKPHQHIIQQKNPIQSKKTKKAVRDEKSNVSQKRKKFKNYYYQEHFVNFQNKKLDLQDNVSFIQQKLVKQDKSQNSASCYNLLLQYKRKRQDRSIQKYPFRTLLKKRILSASQSKQQQKKLSSYTIQTQQKEHDLPKQNQPPPSTRNRLAKSLPGKLHFPPNIFLQKITKMRKQLKQRKNSFNQCKLKSTQLSKIQENFTQPKETVETLKMSEYSFEGQSEQISYKELYLCSLKEIQVLKQQLKAEQKRTHLTKLMYKCEVQKIKRRDAQPLKLQDQLIQRLKSQHLFTYQQKPSLFGQTAQKQISGNMQENSCFQPDMIVQMSQQYIKQSGLISKNHYYDVINQYQVGNSFLIKNNDNSNFFMMNSSIGTADWLSIHSKVSNIHSKVSNKNSNLSKRHSNTSNKTQYCQQQAKSSRQYQYL